MKLKSNREYYPIRIYAESEKDRTQLKEIFAHFKTSGRAAKQIILAYKTGNLEIKFV